MTAADFHKTGSGLDCCGSISFTICLAPGVNAWVHSFGPGKKCDIWKPYGLSARDWKPRGEVDACESVSVADLPKYVDTQGITERCRQS